MIRVELGQADLGTETRRLEPGGPSLADKAGLSGANLSHANLERANL
jgi:uncharacterized protein YjbI with pentapeptide repeats